MSDVLTYALLGGAGYALWRYRDRIEAAIRDVTGAGQGAPPQPPASVPSSTLAAIRSAGVPARDRPLVAAIIAVESGGNPRAHNTAGEDSRGLMQVQLTTAQGLWDVDDGTLGLRRAYARDELGRVLFQPEGGVRIGYAFVRYLRERVPGQYRDAPEDWVIRAYNGGESWHRKGTGVRAATMDYLRKVRAAMAQTGGV